MLLLGGAAIDLPSAGQQTASVRAARVPCAIASGLLHVAMIAGLAVLDAGRLPDRARDTPVSVEILEAAPRPPVVEPVPSLQPPAAELEVPVAAQGAQLAEPGASADLVDAPDPLTVPKVDTASAPAEPVLQAQPVLAPVPVEPIAVLEQEHTVVSPVVPAATDIAAIDAPDDVQAALAPTGTAAAGREVAPAPARTPVRPDSLPAARPVARPAGGAAAAQPALPNSAVLPPGPVAAPSAQAVSSYRSLILAELNRGKTYPEKARAAGIRGRVVVVFTIDATGRAASSAIVESSGNADLDMAAQRAVLGMKLPPPPGGTYSGSAALRFTLDN